MNRWTDRRGSLISCSVSGVNILQKEEDFVLGILGMLLGRIPGFLWNDHKILTISRKKVFQGKIMVFQEGYLIVYTLKVTLYCQKHDNILICREKKHLIFKKLEGYPNLAWAEYLPPWAFLSFFCKISTPELDTVLMGPLEL